MCYNSWVVRRTHLKILLDKEAYHLLPQEEAFSCSYSETVEALRKWFEPVDIEELRGIEFIKWVLDQLSSWG